ncbi:MAG: D-alanyl-D-alanine carboxypeptidase/D-alanyl-D-alanine-endopeptidase [Bacteroidales bacterium]|nr:D-alanyl-D-alanine carboxypeptidase/D-alanyl-D-alanine-endopeptidase [Bacteroidales bacterium]
MMKFFSKLSLFLLFQFSLVSFVVAQNTSALGKAVSDLSKEEVMKHATLSVCVYNLDKKTLVYSYNSQRSVVPASLTKMFTTALGFEKLGRDFRFRTTLAYDGEIDRGGTLRGNLYIIGGGDPLLGSYRYRQTVPDSLFAAWHKAVVSAGIKAVDGRVYYDASIFDNHPIHDNWQWGDIGNYYGAGVCGLNFHENMFFIHFNPGSKVGYPATVSRIEPKGTTLHLVNEVTTGAAKSGDQVVVYGDPGSTIRVCSGTMPIDARNFSVRASLPKPPQACADLFTAYLRQHKLPVSGAATESLKRPSKLVTLLDYTSPTYYVIAQYANITSNNIYAEAIHRYLGYNAHGLGSSANGAKAVSDYFRRLRLETSGVNLEDGSGLSVRNRITTDFVCRFLSELSKTSYFDDFARSLALAGENGTVKNMLTGLPSNVKVRMKTGSMTGVRSYAGLVANSKGERLCFAVVANDFDCTGSQMRTKLEKIIIKIVALTTE